MIDAHISSRPVYVSRARADELAALAPADELEPLAVPLGDPVRRVVRPVLAGVGR